MIEITGNLWHYHDQGMWVCITTNGQVTSDGKLVMGRGCAREARDRFKGLDLWMGQQVKRRGNVVISYYPMRIITFPTKRHWTQPADLELIQRSAVDLMALLDKPLGDIRPPVILPRPGCGQGRLRWEEVRPVLAGILDDRIQVVSNV